jgi:hypothetical protein
VGGSASVALTQADDLEAAGSEGSDGGGGARYLDRNLLFSMGFGEQRVQRALDQNNNDPQVALDVLLNMAPEPVARTPAYVPSVTLAARSAASATFASSADARPAAIIGSNLVNLANPFNPTAIIGSKKRPAEGGAGASASSSLCASSSQRSRHAPTPAPTRAPAPSAASSAAPALGTSTSPALDAPASALPRRRRRRRPQRRRRRPRGRAA